MTNTQSKTAWTVITVECPHCNAEIERGEPFGQSMYFCPECGNEIVVDKPLGED